IDNNSAFRFEFQSSFRDLVISGWNFLRRRVAIASLKCAVFIFVGARKPRLPKFSARSIYIATIGWRLDRNRCWWIWNSSAISRSAEGKRWIDNRCWHCLKQDCFRLRHAIERVLITESRHLISSAWSEVRSPAGRGTGARFNRLGNMCAILFEVLKPLRKFLPTL